MSLWVTHFVMPNRNLLLLLVWLSPSFALATVQDTATLEGNVVSVSVDCRLIVSIDHQAEIVRLFGIDYSNEESRRIQDAREFVRSKVMSKTVRIEHLGKDSRGQIIGRIYIDDCCLNEALIQAGLAEPPCKISHDEIEDDE